MNPEEPTARLKLKEATEDARALGFTVETEDGGRIQKVDGEARPGAGGLIRALLDEATSKELDLGPFVWKQLSGTSHGAIYAVLQGRRKQPHPLDENGLALVPHIQTGDLEWPVTVACLGYAQAFHQMAALYGWDAPFWGRWKQEMTITLIRDRGAWPDDTGLG